MVTGRLTTEDSAEGCAQGMAALRGLDPAQRACVLHPPGPLAIHAGAGSGKTRVLTRRVAYRVLTGTADAHHTVVLTFTRKAASELRHRLAALGVDGVYAGTVHAFARNLLERYWADTGQRPRRVVAQPRRLIGEVVAVMGARAPVDTLAARAAKDTLPGRALVDTVPARVLVDALLGEVEWASARAVGPGDYAAAARRAGRRVAAPVDLVADAYGAYEQLKRRRGVLDIGDLLSELVTALEDPTFAAATRWRFRHVLVDEAQDLNRAQWQVVRAVLGDGDDLCLVGDVHQAIYGWNGADARYLAQLSRAFPGATCLRLSNNYRCAPSVVAVADRVLGAGAGGVLGAGAGGVAPAGAAPAGAGAVEPGGAGGAAPAVPGGAVRLQPPGVAGRDPGVVTVSRYDDDRTEAEAVAWRIRQALAEGVGHGQLAVLGRTHEVLRPVAQALRSARVPVRTGRSLLDEPVVKRAMARLAECPPTLPATGCVSELRLVVADLVAEEADQVALEVEPGRPDDAAVGAHTGVQAQLDQLVELVAEWAAAVPTGTLRYLPDWLASTVRTRGGDVERAGPAVELSTFHRAKGLQWRRVFVIGLEDALVPLRHGTAREPADLDEERRLLYVALTRAEERLHCSWAAVRRRGSRVEPRAPSPYLPAIYAGMEAAAGEPWADGPLTPPEVAVAQLRRIRRSLAQPSRRPA